MSTINPSRVAQHIRSFEKALTGYSEDEPLARFLTRFFKENKQMGSSDRRMTSRYCYNFFRLGDALTTRLPVDRLTVAEFLCEQHSDVVALAEPDWVAHIEKPVAEKLAFLESQGMEIAADLFPFEEGFSAGINSDAFRRSQLVQPDLFIRVQAKALDRVVDALKSNQIDYVQEAANSFRLANGSRLQDLKALEGKYEVQDLSSQETLKYMPIQANDSIWDACAASGGKSLMLLDSFPRLNLLVSDIRLSILRNLDERFENAGIKVPFRKKIIDLTGDITEKLDAELFDGILMDVPCSGSGTWGRTPEMIQQFSMDKIEEFARLQKEISKNVIPFLKPGGYLLYITCSIFKKENEEAVDYLVNECGLILEESKLILGYEKQADSMFIACLRKKA